MDSTEIVESIFSTAQFYEYINLANIINPKPGYVSQRENMFDINISAAFTACFAASCPPPSLYHYLGVSTIKSPTFTVPDHFTHDLCQVGGHL